MWNANATAQQFAHRCTVDALDPLDLGACGLVSTANESTEASIATAWPAFGRPMVEVGARCGPCGRRLPARLLGYEVHSLHALVPGPR